MISKLSFFFLLITINSYAITVLVNKEALNFEAMIDVNNFKIQNVPTLKKACIPVRLNQIKKEKYITTHYINEGSILCKRDIKKYENSGVVFNFGSIQIEKKGKIIYENDKFIRIKRPDGTIEKIYKDGQIK